MGYETLTDERTVEQKRLDAEWARLHDAEAELRAAMRNATSDSERVAIKRRLDGHTTCHRPDGSGRHASTARTSTVTEAEQPSDEDISEFLNTLLTDEEATTESTPRTLSPHSIPPLAWLLLALSSTLTLVYVLSLVLVERPEEGYLTLWDGWVLHAAIFSSAALAGFRALTDRHGRTAWWLVTAGIALYGSGSLVFTYRDQNLDPIPFPGWSDILNLESALALAVALGARHPSIGDSCLTGESIERSRDRSCRCVGSGRVVVRNHSRTERQCGCSAGRACVPAF